LLTRQLRSINRLNFWARSGQLADCFGDQSAYRHTLWAASFGRAVICAEQLTSDIADFEYDKNGNRKKLDYYLNGSINGPNVVTNYSYNLQNNLVDITTKSPSSEMISKFFVFGSSGLDGLGRLKNGRDIISFPGQGNKLHILIYTYDMRSQLTYAYISDIGGSPWIYDYHYRLDGNIDSKVVNVEGTTEYEYDGDIMASATGGDNFSLTWDKNGQLTLKDETIDTNLVYNWDGKLRSATCGPNSISLKYDPMGNRVIKNSSVNGNRKYIIDIAGELPTILMELDPQDNMEIKKTYIYANSQILAQHNGDYNADKYFYLHDRLGSVRLVIDADGTVRNSYTYNPFGESFASECTENVTNPFKFTGQFFDDEISQYYLRARMYNPQSMRFTARDPVRGKYQEPLTLHKYLYCLNDPVDCVDPTGVSLLGLLEAISIWTGENADALVAGGLAFGFLYSLVQSNAYRNVAMTLVASMDDAWQSLGIFMASKTGEAPKPDILSSFQSKWRKPCLRQRSYPPKTADFKIFFIPLAIMT
jgi:RHS repeat-associated protein